MKTCTKCQILKSFSDFHKKKSVKDGYSHWCKSCVQNYDMKEHDSKRILPRKMQGTLIHCRYCEQYLDKSKFHGKLTYCKDCTKLVGHSGNLKRYGLSMDDYMDMEKAQNKLCAICKKSELHKKRLSVDHDHACCPGLTSCGNCIRGLLCSNCNMVLGNAKDNIEILKAAIKYLQK